MCDVQTILWLAAEFVSLLQCVCNLTCVCLRFTYWPSETSVFHCGTFGDLYQKTAYELLKSMYYLDFSVAVCLLPLPARGLPPSEEADGPGTQESWQVESS